jgi:hypothetical protein
MTESIAQQIHLAAEKEYQDALSRIPKGVTDRICLLLECLRVLDVYLVFNGSMPAEKRAPVPDLQIIEAGWNAIAKNLFAECEKPMAIPFFRSSKETFGFATSLLHQFGRSVLARRVADMAKYGLVRLEFNEGKIVARNSDEWVSGLSDDLEFLQWRRLDRIFNEDQSDKFMGWEKFQNDGSGKVPDRVGAFVSRRRRTGLEKALRANINTIMLEQVQTWGPSGGTMLDYTTSQEVDEHFLAVALRELDELRSNAGLHPSVDLGETTASVVSAVAAYIISYHLKHIRFAMLGASKFATIQIEQSLTVWGPKEKIVSAILASTELSQQQIDSALNLLTLKFSDAERLDPYAKPLIPLLVDLGNGLLLRPVASLARNPFETVTSLIQVRGIQRTNAIALPREEWLRTDIYSLFQGNRYVCTQGNVNLRSAGQTLTDVDAAVFDRTTGELALFQLKWQDYSTADLRSLRSKAKNLCQELEHWTQSILTWLGENTADKMAETFRHAPKRDAPVRIVFLFAVSRNKSRVEQFGGSTLLPGLAVSNWPRLLRARMELGAASSVISRMHVALTKEADASVAPKALPYEMKMLDATIRFENMWHSYSDV